MKILIAEDNDLKAEDVKRFILSKKHNAEIVVKTDFRSSLITALEEEFDLYILDMQMPFDNNEYKFNDSCAIDILRYFKLKKINKPVIIITGGEDTFSKAVKNMETFKDTLKGVIFYNCCSIEWQEKLEVFIN